MYASFTMGFDLIGVLMYLIKITCHNEMKRKIATLSEQLQNVLKKS